MFAKFEKIKVLHNVGKMSCCFNKFHFSNIYVKIESVLHLQETDQHCIHTYMFYATYASRLNIQNALSSKPCRLDIPSLLMKETKLIVPINSTDGRHKEYTIYSSPQPPSFSRQN